MSMPHGIILLGANGSGKSALGRELAHALNFAHFDVDKRALEYSCPVVYCDGTKKPGEIVAACDFEAEL